MLKWLKLKLSLYSLTFSFQTIVDAQQRRIDAVQYNEYGNASTYASFRHAFVAEFNWEQFFSFCRAWISGRFRVQNRQRHHRVSSFCSARGPCDLWAPTAVQSILSRPFPFLSRSLSFFLFFCSSFFTAPQQPGLTHPPAAVHLGRCRDLTVRIYLLPVVLSRLSKI